MFRNQRKISLYFVPFLHSEVAWEAQSSILSVKLYMNIRGTTPRGAPPRKGKIMQAVKTTPRNIQVKGAPLVPGTVQAHHHRLEKAQR